MCILTLIKNMPKRCVREEFPDFSQDICFGRKRRIFIPDLYHVFPFSHTNTDPNHFIICETRGGQEEQQS